jgi:hypothetical protein
MMRAQQTLPSRFHCFIARSPLEILKQAIDQLEPGCMLSAHFISGPSSDGPAQQETILNHAVAEAAEKLVITKRISQSKDAPEPSVITAAPDWSDCEGTWIQKPNRLMGSR